MALATTLQPTESNLFGTLNAAITSSALSLTATFVDKVTGAPRAPQPTTLLFVVDKGTPTAPNPQYEIILSASHSTSSGITTIVIAARGLAMFGNSLAAGTGKAHVAGAEIGCVDTHYLWNTTQATLKGVGDTIIVTTFASLAALAADVPAPIDGMVVYVTGVGWLFRQSNSWFGTPKLVFFDAAARDAAIATPQNGMECYLVTEGVNSDYTAGIWMDRSVGGVTPNASTTVAGKVQEATQAEMDAFTGTGTTGARLFVNPSTLVSLFHTGVAGEALVAGSCIYQKQSDNLLYNASNDTEEHAAFIGFVTVGGAMGDTVFYATPGETLTTAGLSPGATYYLSTAGAITPIHPSMSTVAVIPVIVGVASSATKLIIRDQRLQRRIYFLGTRLGTDGSGTQTVTIGIPYERVDFTGSRTADGTAGFDTASGFFDAVSGLNFFAHLAPNAFFVEDADAIGSATATMAVSGTDITLTWTLSNWSGANNIVYAGVAYELL